jgi:uncharacterized protein (TIGR03118 family)
MIFQNKIARLIALIALLVVAVGMISSSAFAQYTVTNLVSNQPGHANHQDASLINAWGVSYAPGGPFWVSDNGTGLSTLYDATGVKQGLVVTIPAASGSGQGTPTGQVYNGTPDFVVKQGTLSGPALFLFATADGTISGWSPSVSATAAVIGVTAPKGTEYTGLAIGVSNGANFLYAADNNNNKVDMYDKNFHLVKSFTDSSLAAGSNPYNAQIVQGKLIVTFNNHGTGGGAVTAFDTAGNKLKTFIVDGPLHDPWGVALAPSNFGAASNALLVGNVADGLINAFNARTGAFIGTSAVAFPGLWSLTFGGGSPADGKTNQLFLASGPGGYLDGLFSVVAPK